MDEEEELQNTLIGQNPMMEEQPILNVEDNRLGGNAQEVLGLTGALAGIRTNPFLTGSMNQAASPSLSPATGPSGGTRLPTQPSLEQASRAASRTAGMGSYSGTTGELSRGKGFDLNSNRIGSSLASNIVKGATQGIIGVPSLFLNPNETADATLSGANQRAAEQGEPLPFPDAPNAEFLQLLKPSSAESTGPTPSEGQSSGSTINDIVQSIGDFFSGGREVSGLGGSMGLPPTFTPPSADATPSEDAVDIQPITLESLGLESPQQRMLKEAVANQGVMAGPEVAPTLPPAAQSFFGQAPASSASEAGQRLINAGNNAVESIPSLPEGVQANSPQANFLNRIRSGEALTQEEINAANQFAQSIGTTFDPETGYSRDAFLGSQATAPRSDTFPNDAGVQRTRDELMRRFGAPTISQIQEQDARRTSGNVAIPAPAAVNNFAPQVDGRGKVVGLPISEGNPVPMPGTRPGDRNPFQGDPGFIQQPSLRDPDEGFTRQPPQNIDPGFTRERPNIINSQGKNPFFQGEGEAREFRINSRPDFNQPISDRERRGGGLSQADARDLAQGMDRNASEGQRMRALEIQSRLGLGQFKPEKELTDLEKREIESRIRGRDANIAATERKGGFSPRVIDVGGERAMELSPGYFQRIAKDKPNKTGLESTIENLQADLTSGRLTQDQYDIAVSNAKNLYIGLKQPKQNETDVSNRISELQNEAMGVTSAEGTDASDIRSFDTEAEAKASGVKGEVLIGGRRAVIE